MKKILIILLSSILSLNLSAQFRSTSMYLDGDAVKTEKVESANPQKWMTADEYLQSVSYNPAKNQEEVMRRSSAYRAPGKPNDPFPTPMSGSELPLALAIYAVVFGVYKFVKDGEK